MRDSVLNALKELAELCDLNLEKAQSCETSRGELEKKTIGKAVIETEKISADCLATFRRSFVSKEDFEKILEDLLSKEYDKANVSIRDWKQFGDYFTVNFRVTVWSVTTISESNKMKFISDR